MFSVFLLIYFLNIMITYLFQGEEEDSDEMIGMERATSLCSEQVAHDESTVMIGIGTATDDEEVLVIFAQYEKCSKPFCWK